MTYSRLKIGYKRFHIDLQDSTRLSSYTKTSVNLASDTNLSWPHFLGHDYTYYSPLIGKPNVSPKLLVTDYKEE